MKNVGPIMCVLLAAAVISACTAPGKRTNGVTDAPAYAGETMKVKPADVPKVPPLDLPEDTADASANRPTGEFPSAPFFQPLIGLLLPADYEIEDVRRLSQEIGTYTSPLTGASLGQGCRDGLAADFRKKYYAPWTTDKPLTDTADFVRAMKAHGKREWFGENRRKVPQEIIDELLDNGDPDHLPSMSRPAVTTSPTSMRILPTTKPLFDKSDGFPFDLLQQSGLKMNEPLRILHVSRDGLWVFAEASHASGWVEARDIGYVDEGFARSWMGKEQVVVIRDGTTVRDETGAVARKVKLGTLFPLAREGDDAYEAYSAIATEKGEAREVRVKMAKDAARRHPMAFSGEAVAQVGNVLIGTPYGWGELFDDRDCSAMIRDFFLPFGIWLPRGSYGQIHSGPNISLAGMSRSEKERTLREKGVPFLTLVYLKGHIMLYVGTVGGTPLVFHDLWGVTVRNAVGDGVKQVIGKAIVSTLTPGSELPLANGPLLDKISSILVLTDRCASHNPH